MEQCPRGTCQNLEDASQDDDPKFGEDQAKGEYTARQEEKRGPTGTPDEEEDKEPPRRGEGTPTRRTAPRGESLQSASQRRSASHVPGGMWLSQRGGEKRRTVNKGTKKEPKNNKDKRLIRNIC
ncbi:hypothetical protein NDU88_006948 [Pleurodeles waltl]|uniref:Uncharacterized protein n=1 Tax=Pleurodeles waltl TaxID=8319 RepID=A0AAV7N8T9_PLEWA|nr:hypothetical protein NDU88_006948 [Pleurodeles waltl]